MNRFRLIPLVMVCLGTLALAGCEDDATKAERFYQSGLALIAEGDSERALVELRNVFRHDGFHREARQTYADLVLEMGRTQEAYSQYLRLVEQYPDTVPARVTLAELAIRSNSWEEAERHGAAAVDLAPEDPDVRAIDLALQYRRASIANDEQARGAVAAEATELLQTMRDADRADNDILLRVMIEDLMRSDTPADALPVVDAALARTPEAEDLNMMKARLLADSGDTEGTGAQLRRMVALYPDNTEITQAMLNWHLIQGDTAGAEAFLRSQADEDTAQETEGHVTVIRFLQSSQGADAARVETDRLIAVNADTETGRFYQALRASLDFQTGQQDKAIADLRTAIAASGEEAQKTRLQMILAQMLNATDDRDAALVLVDEVLENDPSNVAALRIAGRAADRDGPLRRGDRGPAGGAQPEPARRRDPDADGAGARARRRHQSGGRTAVAGDGGVGQRRPPRRCAMPGS